MSLSGLALDTGHPTGGEMISEIDDMIKGDRGIIDQILRKMSGYPNHAYLRIPTWTNSSKPGSPKEGYMGFNTDENKFQYFNGSAWIFLEYKAESCTGNANTATSATNARNDGDGNQIKTTYLKVSEVANANNKVPRFTSNGRIQFPNGAQFWVV